MDDLKETIVPGCRIYLEPTADWTDQRRFMDSHTVGYMHYHELATQYADMCDGKGLRIVDLTKTTAREHKLMFQKLVETASTHLRSWELGSHLKVMDELLNAYSYGFSIRRNTKIPVKMPARERHPFYAFLAPLLFDAFYHLTEVEQSGDLIGTSIYLTSQGLIPYVTHVE